MRSFIAFIREQGVVGLAIGFILGGAINGVIASFVKDVLQPLLAFVVGTESLLVLQVGGVMYGRFLVALIDFLMLAAVVFFLFKKLKLDSLDLNKEIK
jgi:large conductance mechanosensitive channel